MYFKSKEVTIKSFLFLYVFLISTFSFLSYQFFITNFQELESNKNYNDVNTVLEMLTSNIKHIENITNDYSYWDQTVALVNQEKTSFIYDNFREGSNTLESLDLDFMIFVNKQNKIIYATYKNKDFIVDKKAFETQIIKNTLKNEESNSLLKIDSNIFYLRKSKIVNTVHKRKVSGFLYSGRFITEKLLQEEHKSFHSVGIMLHKSTKEPEESYKKELFNLHSVVVNTYMENQDFVNEIEFFDLNDNYLFTIKAQNSMDILTSGKNTIFLYNAAVAILLFIIFIILRHVQNDLSASNIKLEQQVNERTKKLNEYIGIVNKYVTTSSTDLEGNITDVSEAFSRICGYSKEELIGRNHRVVKHPDMDPSVYVDLWDTITQDKKWVGEILNQKKNGEAYWVLANIDPIFSDEGQKIGYTSIRQEITDKKRVEKLSVTDKLTQLYNRVRLEEIFTVEIAKFHRYNTKFSMILIDIDHFKEVNDTHGHNVGDSLLQEIAKVLRSSVRIEDVVGRWGGEEFIILSNNYTVEGVMQLAEKIRKNIEEYNFKVVGKKTASFGVAILNKEDTQESLIYRADKSLYHAKKTGRNKVCLH